MTEKTWYVVDATDLVLGRLASTIAVHIRGKNLATYTPSVDMGAFVIVVCCLHKNCHFTRESGLQDSGYLVNSNSGRLKSLFYIFFLFITVDLLQSITCKVMSFIVFKCVDKCRESLCVR